MGLGVRRSGGRTGILLGPSLRGGAHKWGRQVLPFYLARCSRNQDVVNTELCDEQMRPGCTRMSHCRSRNEITNRLLALSRCGLEFRFCGNLLPKTFVGLVLMKSLNQYKAPWENSHPPLVTFYGFRGPVFPACDEVKE